MKSAECAVKGGKGLVGLLKDLASTLGFVDKTVKEIDKGKDRKTSNKDQKTSNFKDSEIYDDLEYDTQRRDEDSVTYRNDDGKTKTVHQKHVDEELPIVFD